MVFKVVQLIPRRRQGSIHCHPPFQYREPIDFHWFYKVFRLTVRFPGVPFFWPAEYAYFTMGLKHFWRRRFIWPFDVDSLANASTFHVICMG